MAGILVYIAESEYMSKSISSEKKKRKRGAEYMQKEISEKIQREKEK